MKRENFEDVKKIIAKIEEREMLIADIDAFNKRTEGVDVRLYIGSITVNVPSRHSSLSRKFSIELRNEVQAELDSLNAQLHDL